MDEADAPSSKEEFTYDFWFGSTNVGRLVGHTKGEVTWDGQGGGLAISVAPIRQAFWEPRRERAEGEEKPRSPLMRIGRQEYVLKRVADVQWRVEKAEHTPDPGLDREHAERLGIEIGRLFYPILTSRPSAGLSTFDMSTITDKPPRTVEVSPWTGQSHAPVRDDEAELRVGTDLVLVRTEGLNTELVALHYGDGVTRAVFANVWAGGAHFEGNRADLADEGVEKVRAFFRSLVVIRTLSDDHVIGFVNAWDNWRADMDMHLYLIEFRPKGHAPAPEVQEQPDK